jgi:hypothetical protein
MVYKNPKYHYYICINIIIIIIKKTYFLPFLFDSLEAPGFVPETFAADLVSGPVTSLGLVD